MFKEERTTGQDRKTRKQVTGQREGTENRKRKE
jgi:hypothetical protein